MISNVPKPLMRAMPLNQPSAALKLAVIPSTYALGAWVVTLAAAPFAPLPINDLSSTGTLVITYALFCFALSMMVNYRLASKSMLSVRLPDLDGTVLFVFALASAIGLAGLAQYLLSIIPVVGGIDGLIYIIVSQDFLAIRMVSSQISTIGVNLSYFSWLGIYLGIIFLLKPSRFKYLKAPIALLTLLQIGGNLLFVDRTRPMWIAIPLLMALWFGKKHYDINLKRVSIILLVFPIVFFFLFTLLTGKYSQYGVIDNFFVYLTGAYGYLDSLIVTGNNPDMYPIRMGYWIAKIIELVGYPIAIPDQILEFRAVPFRTNVGTFLEPLYGDGGLLYIFIFTPIIVIGLDRVALNMYARSTYLGLFVWGNIIFFSMISFFVPKFNALPLWLFLAIALMGDAARRHTVRRSASAADT